MCTSTPRTMKTAHRLKSVPLFSQEDWESFIQVHFTAEVVNMAKAVATGLALRGADAVHLASALVLQNRFAEGEDQSIFVASDRELKQAAQSSNLVVIDPAEQQEQSSSSIKEGERG